MLSREEIEKVLAKWYRAWNEHDLDGVRELFHDEVLFENWTGGRVKGKDALIEAWAPWFANHGGFRFTEEETFRLFGISHGNHEFQSMTPPYLDTDSIKRSDVV